MQPTNELTVSERVDNGLADESTSELVSSFAHALGDGDHNQLATLLSEHVAYQAPGRSAIAGVHRGRQNVMSILMTPTAPGTEIQSTLVTEQMTDGQRGFVAVMMNGRGHRGHFEFEVALHLQTDGESITGITEYSGDQYVADELLGGPLPQPDAQAPPTAEPIQPARNGWFRTLLRRSR